MIYAIEAVGLDRVKFGRAIKPVTRLKKLSTGSPVPLKLLAVAEWPDDHEIMIHDAFRDFRICGEWFDVCPIVAEFLSTFMCSKRSDDDKYWSCMEILSGLVPGRKPGPLTSAEKMRRYRARLGDEYRKRDRDRKRRKKTDRKLTHPLPSVTIPLPQQMR